MLEPSAVIVQPDLREDPEMPPVAPPGERPFVGREAELAELRLGLDAVLGGAGRTFLISGEPGIGKTRLASELGHEARARGARVEWGRCWEAGGAPSYWPWVEVIRLLAAASDAPARIDLGRRGLHLAQIVPELAERLGVAEIAPPVPTDPESARFLLFDAVAAFFRDAASRAPLVIVVDDLHAADRASLLLFAFLARALADCGVLLIGTHRDHEGAFTGDPATPLADLGRHTRRLPLRGLGTRDVGSFIESIADWRPTDSFLERIHSATDGNPFFVDEILRLLVSEGRLRDAEDRSIPLGIPEGARDIVTKRLAGLPDQSKLALEFASIVGREFDLDVVRRAFAIDLVSLLDALDIPVRFGLVLEVSGRFSRLQFRHALIREVLYEGIPLAVRLTRHKLVGEALESIVDADPDRYVAELAHHFLMAAPCDDRQRFFAHGVRAARHAMTRMAFEEAANLYERILASMVDGAQDHRRRCELLLALGNAREWANNAAGSRAAIRQAAELARHLDATELLVAAALGIGAIGARKFTATSRCEAAPDLLSEALTKVSPTDHICRARLIGRLALHRLSTGLRDEALALTDEAVQIARCSQDLETLGEALTARHAVLFGPDHLDEREAIAQEMLAIAHRLNSGELAMRAEALRITILFELGDLDGVSASLESHARLATESSDPFECWANLVWRAARVLADGRFAKAELYSQQAFELVESTAGLHTAEFYGPTTFAGQRILIREARDDRDFDDESHAYFQAQFPEISAWRVTKISYCTRAGRVADARRELDALAANGFADFERNGTWLASMSYLSEAVEFVGDKARANILYRLLLPYADRNITVSHVACRGSVARALGLLAATLGLADEAKRHFDHAIAMNRRMNMRSYLAFTYIDYARCLLRWSTADHEFVRVMLREATHLGDELSASGIVERCLALEEKLRDRCQASASRTAIQLEKAGNLWVLSRGSEQIHVVHAKGLIYIAELLGHPGREIHAQDLLALTGNQVTADHEASREGLPLTVAQPAVAFVDEVLDARARRAYRRRASELVEELAACESSGDPERTLSLREELDALRRELARGTGLGGRARHASDAERARVSVTRAIRLALARIADEAPALGAELDRDIRTGTFCVYERRGAEA